MERFTISIDAELIAAFDAFIAEKGYENRSEAVRDLIREELNAQRLNAADGTAPAVACLSYVYDHDQQRLATRLINAQHHRLNMSRATMHVHLNKQDCMEVTILEGPANAVRRFADEVISDRGVRHGQLNIVLAENRGDADDDHDHELLP